MKMTSSNTSLTNLEASTAIPEFVQVTVGQFGTSKAIRFYGSFVLVVVGLICNSFTLLVMLSTKLRNTSYGLYLSALAIADSSVLVAELIKLSDDPRIGGSWASYSNATCKFTFHLRYSAQLLSAMLITSITVERFLVIAFPLKMAVLRKIKTAKAIILIEYIIAAILGSYGSILFELIQFYPGMTPICLMDMAQTEIYLECNLYIAKVFGEVILPSIVVVFTLLIIRAVLVAAKARKQQLSNSNSNSSGKRQSSFEVQLTAMLLTVAASFVLLRVPYTVCWYMGHYGTDASSMVTNTLLNNSTNVTYVFMVANYSINFFLYCLSGGTFRENMMAVLHCRPNSVGRGASAKYSNSNSSMFVETELGTMETLSRSNSKV